MLLMIARRLVSMLLIMIVVSLILFLIFENDKPAIARAILGPYVQDFQLEAWLEANGYNRPFFTRYLEWVGNVLQGDFGESTRYKSDVGPIMWERLEQDGAAGRSRVPVHDPDLADIGRVGRNARRLDARSRHHGVFGHHHVDPGIRDGDVPARYLRVLGLGFTGLGSRPISTTASGSAIWCCRWRHLVIYDMGYVARMTRASMAEVMQSQYIRTAILKGVSFKNVVTKHALRNALIAPFTIIVLQLNWLLSGVIVVELFFNYKGFGLLLYEAALTKDVFMLEACTLIAVVVAVGSQIISDVGYMYLNPRIRFS